MKLWNKKNKLTATNDLVDFILMKLYEEPEEWKCDKYGSSVYHWRYKDAAIYVGHSRIGEIQDGEGVDGTIEISSKQSKLIAAATENMRAAKALRHIMKVAIKNVT